MGSSAGPRVPPDAGPGSCHHRSGAHGWRVGWWCWFRRGWWRVRRLQHVWIHALRDPRVLALPTGEPDHDDGHMFRVRERHRTTGGGLRVRVLADDVPPLGPTTLAPGRARLSVVDRAARLAPAAGEFVALPAGTGMVSGSRKMFATRRHWITLPDGSQVALACAAVRPLRTLATSAGLRVV